MGANAHVVPDLDLVIQFNPVFNHGIIQRTAVNRRVRANFDVVADDYPANLRNFSPAPFFPCNTETIRANHYS